MYDRFLHIVKRIGTRELVAVFSDGEEYCLNYKCLVERFRNLMKHRCPRESFDGELSALSAMHEELKIDHKAFLVAEGWDKYFVPSGLTCIYGIPDDVKIDWFFGAMELIDYALDSGIKTYEEGQREPKPTSPVYEETKSLVDEIEEETGTTIPRID